jgi:hypothetical protein
MASTILAFVSVIDHLLLWVNKDSGWIINHRNGAKLIKSCAFVKRIKAFENIFAAVCQNILLPLKKTGRIMERKLYKSKRSR